MSGHGDGEGRPAADRTGGGGDRASATGTLYDLGYQRYEGERRGRLHAVRALYVQGLRVVFAVDRGARARLIPLALGAFALLPALVQATVAVYTGPMFTLITYSNYFLNIAIIVSLFCAAQAPELVSADLRSRTIVLYLARALRRREYLVARLLSLGTAVFLLCAVPLLILFLGKVFAAADPWPALRTESSELLPILGSSLAVAALMASVSLAIASLTSRRAFAAAGVIGFFLVLAAISGILQEALRDAWSDELALLNPHVALGGLTNWMFDASPRQWEQLYGMELSGTACALASAGFVALALLVLWLRFRRIEG